MTRKMQEPELRQLADGLARGLSCREVAALIGVSPATAIRWTQRCGLTSQRARRLAPEARLALREALRSGAATLEAAARFGVSARTAARHAEPTRNAERRRGVIDRLRAGASLREAAAQAGVSSSTAGRWARAAALPPATRRKAARRQDEAMALSAMESGMRPDEAATAFGLDAEAVARLARRPRLSPERLARRERLFAALASGLSARKAAALLQMPVATAIRWARTRAAVEN